MIILNLELKIESNEKLHKLVFLNEKMHVLRQKLVEILQDT